MKYKLYYIKDKNHQYYNEIRGIRYSHQYQHLPECAEYIDKEYDSDKDGIPDLFFKENRQNINFARYKIKSDLSGIEEITSTEFLNNPRYISFQKEKQIKNKLEKALAKSERIKKITELEKIKIASPELSTEAQKMIDKLNAEEAQILNPIGEL